MPASEQVDLAIEVRAAGSVRQGWTLPAWARKAGVPLLSVESGATELRIGPLAMPDQPGCEWCAASRIAGAAGSGPGSPKGATFQPDWRALAGEVRAILRHGAEACRLRGHVLLESRGQSSLHRVIPMPQCPVCGGGTAQTGTTPRLSAKLPMENIVERLSGWIDPRTGIINRIFIDRPFGSAKGMPFVITAAPPHLADRPGTLRRFPVGWGKGLNGSTALLSAVGEAMERYSASLPDPRRLVWARIGELSGDVLDPRECPLYSEQQYRRRGFPYARFDANSVHPWVAGKWLGSRRAVWVPAIFAFLSLTVTREQLICQGTSNGLACSTSLEDAARRATLELVERDALLTAWMTGRAASPIEVTDSASRQILAAFECPVETYLLPDSALGFTVLCLARGDGKQYPAATIALGCDPDQATAVKQAVLELAQTGPHLRRLMTSKACPVPRTARDVKSMLDHAAFYFSPRRAVAFDRILCAGTRRQPPAKGIRVAIVDVTSADLTGSPFRVARAVSPDLQPISYGYGLDRVPVARIRALGLADDVPPIHPIW